ncbi:hypothetical protein BO83DRAFT_235878 [Aspergillus eucalypticola CBS 122712]|uniref:Transmembrane protein n=1 Tax=Aspergillus eucalypticola (strain CBS 122712 / IBT 29274) TaxID=1448314 RepID=A0A317VXP2_ASPEC|nr:uncharacterized protein BO83DRAFT_235878 [Aspergillus eucalypticola CBS 122712]PWY76640.1 hypothetical protein BO83DRAFT_235878 [Aspergillus eucalypticola CBS 122712]
MYLFFSRGFEMKKRCRGVSCGVKRKRKVERGRGPSLGNPHGILTDGLPRSSLPSFSLSLSLSLSTPYYSNIIIIIIFLFLIFHPHASRPSPQMASHQSRRFPLMILISSPDSFPASVFPIGGVGCF